MFSGEEEGGDGVKEEESKNVKTGGKEGRKGERGDREAS